ncbi:hypothetical protein [Halomonas sp. YLGW01]|uniref:hypothetical protein n=1 Tax=Halomonas sp. YLGW01 TaxID=2773308 RepID=UPI00178389BB|nr:hypothetical protein [Halomonas sp. YLGW01]
MPARETSSGWMRYGSVAALIGLVFVVDLQLPRGIAGGEPYVAAVLLALWTRDSRGVVGVAAICTLMTVLGYYFSPPGGEPWQVLLNRLLAIFAIWVTAILSISWMRKTEELHTMAREREKEKIYLATLYSAQHIINNLINQLYYVKMEAEKCPEFPQASIVVFDRVLEEGEALMVQLSEVDDISEEAIRKAVLPRQAATRPGD